MFRFRRRSIVDLSVIAAVLLLAASSAVSARILRSKRTPSETWNPWLPLTIGSGFEFETDKEQTQYDYPMLLEYNFSQTLKLTVEPNITYIVGKKKDVRTVAGFADLETSVEYEFIRERRYRPGVTAEGAIRWPTSTDPDIGDPGRDYSLGLIFSKDLVFVDLDLTTLYTFVGDSKAKDVFELTLAAEWHLNHFIDLEGEVLHSFGAGGIHGRAGSLAGAGGGAKGVDLTEGTLGIGWHISKRFKVEAGGIVRSDNTWQIVFAWEWSFTGD